MMKCLSSIHMIMMSLSLLLILPNLNPGVKYEPLLTPTQKQDKQNRQGYKKRQQTPAGHHRFAGAD